MLFQLDVYQDKVGIFGLYWDLRVLIFFRKFIGWAYKSQNFNARIRSHIAEVKNKFQQCCIMVGWCLKLVALYNEWIYIPCLECMHHSLIHLMRRSCCKLGSKFRTLCISRRMPKKRGEVEVAIFGHAKNPGEVAVGWKKWRVRDRIVRCRFHE